MLDHPWDSRAGVRRYRDIFGCVPGAASPHFFMALLARVSWGSPAQAGNGWRRPPKDQGWMWQRRSNAGHCQAGARACSPRLHCPRTPPDLRQEMRFRTGMQMSQSRSLADGAALDPCLGLTLGLWEREEEEEEERGTSPWQARAAHHAS